MRRSLKIGTLAVVLTVLCVLALGSIAQAKGAPVDRIALKAQQLLADGYLASPKDVQRGKKAKTSPENSSAVVAFPSPKSHEARVNRALVELQLVNKAPIGAIAIVTRQKTNEYTGILQASILDVKAQKGAVEGRYVHSNPLPGKAFADAYHAHCVKLYGPLVVGGSTKSHQSSRVSKNVSEWVSKYSKAFNVPEALIFATMQRESGFQHYRKDGSIVTSSKGALGLMQLMPGTARMLGVNPKDPEDNVKGGVKYLAQGLKRNGALVGAFYIGGPGFADKVEKFGISDKTEVGRYVHGIAQVVRGASEPRFASLKK